MKIRYAVMNELDEILSVYESARTYMRKNGNLSQWTGGYPQRELIEEDIALNRLFVIEDNGICGVFVFFVGNDPTYETIDGAWADSSPYGVIHRIASNGRSSGILSSALDFCFGKINHIRIDTHADNSVMRALLENHGFSYRGTIFLADGSPRRAYEKTLSHS